MVNKNTEMLSVSTVASRLNVTKNTILKLIHEGDMQAYKVRSIFRIKESDYQDYMEKQKTKTD